MPEQGDLPSERRPLGETGLMVSTLCFGCASLGDMPDTFGYSVSEDRARETLASIFESPINFIDTAASYGDGESERRIGLALRERGGLPKGSVLATKADRDPTTGDFSGEQMRRSVERSLRLLDLESIQLLYLHDPEALSEPNREPFEYMMDSGGPVETLLGLKDEGLIENLGVAGGPVDLLIRLVETGLFEAVITHNKYTLLDQSAELLLDAAHRRKVAALNAAPYGGGILARGPEEYPRYAYDSASETLLHKARKMSRMCHEFDVPLAAAALHFSLSERRVSSTIVGVSSPEHVEQTLRLATYPIPGELQNKMRRLAFANDG